MAGGDSLQLVIAEISKSVAGFRDTLALIGFYYTGKFTLKCISAGMYACRVYMLPKLISNDKWLKSLGTWAIVTGCTHGIGLAYAKELAKRGFNVILIAKNEELLEKVSQNLEEKYKVKCIKVCVDLADTSTFEKIERVVLAKDIGILVNNVGVSSDPTFFHLTSCDLIERIINVNLKPLTLITRMVLPDMVKKNKGAIVNVSSSAVYVPAAFFSVYAATKAFTHKFTESLCYEYRKTKISFQCLSTGLVTTQMTAKRVGKHNCGFKMDALRYAAFALKTLGYSNSTSGHWFHGLQLISYNLMPKWLFNKLVVCELEKMLIKHRDEHHVQHHFNDMDEILSAD